MDVLSVYIKLYTFLLKKILLRPDYCRSAVRIPEYKRKSAIFQFTLGTETSSFRSIY
jgi:hypothetical protein